MAPTGRDAPPAAADAAGGRQRLFEAEQTQLLAHLAADSGARRGELAALLAGDLAGRVLGVHQAISGLDTLTCPKTHQYRSITLGSVTATLWHRHLQHFPVLERGQDWLFAPDPDRATFIHPRGLAARFERLRGVAGVPDATLHRLRHTVAVILVAAGHVLPRSIDSVTATRRPHCATTAGCYRPTTPPSPTSSRSSLPSAYEGGRFPHFGPAAGVRPIPWLPVALRLFLDLVAGAAARTS